MSFSSVLTPSSTPFGVLVKSTIYLRGQDLKGTPAKMGLYRQFDGPLTRRHGVMVILKCLGGCGSVVIVSQHGRRTLGPFR